LYIGSNLKIDRSPSTVLHIGHFGRYAGSAQSSSIERRNGMEWYLMVWRKYAEFDGRARRQEYWMFQLFNILAMLALAILGGIAIAINRNFGVILFFPFALYWLAIIIPSIAVAVRRFHDTGRSGWMLLLFVALGIIPVVGFISAIIQIVFMCQDSVPGTNEYGPSPKYPDQFNSAFAMSAPNRSMGLYGQPPSAPISPEGPAISFCNTCRTMLNPGSRYCSTCGAQN
jgi:uncharacterized membrane protein YhaH (DUF805 family)